MNKVPEKLKSALGPEGVKAMAAGLEKTALMASWGAAIPTPPILRDMGPIPIKLSPLVARTIVALRAMKRKTLSNKIHFFISPPYDSLKLINADSSFLFFLLSLQLFYGTRASDIMEERNCTFIPI
jgi:hypothetical protein